MPARRWPVLLCLGGALTLTACGTTVSGTTAAAGGPAGQTSTGETDGLRAIADPGGSTQQGTGVAPPGSSGSSGADTTAGSSAGSTTGTSGAPAEGVAAPAGATAVPAGPAGSAPGVTATTIKIGVYTVQAFNDVTESAGIKVSTGNQARQARATIDRINRTGGIAGRKVIPVFHDFDVGTAATDVNSEYQSACAAWTQDDRVYAVATPVGTLNDTLYACLAKAGVITSATGDTKDERFFREFHDHFYMPVEINMTRMLADSARALHANGFFGTGAKVGVVRLDTIGEQRAVADGLRPALARIGLKVEKEFAAPVSSDGSSAYSSAVLQFKAAGITHVVFSELGSPLAFTANAESQDYRPRYAFNSRNGPASVLQSNVPAAQLRRSMGYGWMPMNDVDAQRDPGPTSPRQTLCNAIMKEAGEDTSIRSTAAVAFYICDSLFFLDEALERAPDFTVAGFRAGAESLGSYQTASTFSAGLAPGRLHDGARAYRLFAFQDQCRCFAYVTPVATAR